MDVRRWHQGGEAVDQFQRGQDLRATAAGAGPGVLVEQVLGIPLLQPFQRERGGRSNAAVAPAPAGLWPRCAPRRPRKSRRRGRLGLLHLVKPRQLDLQDYLIEEQQRALRLILRRRRTCLRSWSSPATSTRCSTSLDYAQRCLAIGTAKMFLPDMPPSASRLYQSKSAMNETHNPAVNRTCAKSRAGRLL